MIAALLAAAWAHGPAPAVLEVLDWEPGVCAPVAPSLVRTNIGLMLAAPTGGYSYGCPSRWGGAE
ncbi:MAG TPA: hypothetical protein PKA64_16165, partial [Myxococcota bacterium]|nr:hypothetical protein [Myxococcota bacterium]